MLVFSRWEIIKYRATKKKSRQWVSWFLLLSSILERKLQDGFFFNKIKFILFSRFSRIAYFSEPRTRIFFKGRERGVINVIIKGFITPNARRSWCKLSHINTNTSTSVCKTRWSQWHDSYQRNASDNSWDK